MGVCWNDALVENIGNIVEISGNILYYVVLVYKYLICFSDVLYVVKIIYICQKYLEWFSLKSYF